MVVFVGNLPKQAAEKDLCQIARLAPTTPVRIFRKKSRGGDIQRYALIPNGNGKQARRVINRLHGFLWFGHRLVARNYCQRTAANEQRRVDWRSQHWDGVERRQRERRNLAAA